MFNLFRTKDPKRLAKKAERTTNPLEAVELYSDAIMYEKKKEYPYTKLLSDLFLKRGEIHLNNGVAILSSSDFLQSIENDLKNGIAHNDLGIWHTIEHFNTPDFDKALEHLDKAVKYCPERQDFKMNRAVIKIKMGNKIAGRNELEQLIQNGYEPARIAIEKFCD